MKFSFVAALVVLAIAHGTESVSLVKRQAPPDIKDIQKYFQDLSSMFTSNTTDLVEKLKAHDLTSQAKAYLEGRRAQLEPLVEKLREQLKPLAGDVKAQLEEFLKTVMHETKALNPPAQ